MKAKNRKREEMLKILIVEDDNNIAKLIETTVTMGGYLGQICHNGKEAFELIKENHYDLILLDIMLPDMDGFTIMQKIKNEEVPVIFITAMQEVADRVKGLRLGAEDYIVKPFEAIELLARIEVVFRRIKKGQNIYNYDDLVVNVEEHTCKRGNKIINLTPKEFETLVFFLQHKDIAISRERLLATVWGYEFEGETRTVDIHIQQIRKKVDLKGKLVTVPKLGYRLESL